MIRVLSLCLILLALPVRAQTVVDGDTLKLDGTTYRLHGIDAPESKQTCSGWPAGAEASAYMRALLRDRRVSCTPLGHDRYGRTLGKCTADGIDIQAEMVRQGMAWAYIKYSHDYVAQEQQAKREGLGIWRYGCQPAWEWRAEHKH
jgi:endonuclease YncB( thermonuclease family)